MSSILKNRINPLVSNTLSVTILRGANTLTRVICLFIIARFLNPDIFGMIVFAMTVAEIAKVVADFGVDTLVIREFATTQNESYRQRLAATVAQTKIVCGLIAYAALLLFLALTEPQEQLQIGAVAGLLIFTGLWQNFSLNYFQARLQTNQIIVPVVAINAVTIAVIALLFLIYPSILLTVAILPVAEAVSAAIVLGRFRRLVPIHIGGAPVAEIKTLLRRALPIGGTIVIVTLYTRLDVIVLSSFADTAAVGFYGLAFRLTEPVLLVAAAFAMSVYSHIAATLADDRQDTSRMILRYAAITFGYGALCGLALALIAPLVIQWLLPQYTPAITILRILAIALIFRTLNSCLTSTIQAYGHFSWITRLAVFNLFVISGLLWVLVPLWGAPGAALSLLCGEMLNTLIQLVLVKQTVARQRQILSREEARSL
ncbi:MAG TPA: oligosaccharide flippase family protein [Herpetosiphonaceae bacterium]